MPGLSRPSSSAWASASGMEAEEVLPYRSTFTITLSIGMFGVLRRRLDDPEVGLVRHEEVDLVGGDAGAA